MSLSIESEILDIIGIVYSAVGVTLSVINCCFLKKHSRSLDHIQWAYFLAYYTSSKSLAPFSLQLEVGSSNISLPEASQSGFFCPMGAFVCRAPFALSFLVILCGLLLVLRLITILEKIKSKISYSRIYTSLKGFFKWFYLPLFVLSLELLFSEVKSEIIPSAVVLGVLIVFPIVQLILTALFNAEKEDSTTNLLEFLSYVKAALFSLLIVVYYRYSSTVFLYYLILILAAFGIVFVWYNIFYLAVASRVLFISGEIIFLFLFSLYAGYSPWLSMYYLDLFGIGVILVLDLVYTFMEMRGAYKEWKEKSSEIVPEDSREEIMQKRSRLDVSEDVNDLHEINKMESRNALNDERESEENLYPNNSSKRLDSKPKIGK